MAAGRGVAIVVLILIAGLVVGSLLGELLGGLLASGRARDLLTKGPTIGITSPATLDLRFMALTFGLVFKVNLGGAVGIVVAALSLRKL